MRGPGRDIGYSECAGSGRADIVNAGTGETDIVNADNIVNAGPGRADIVNAGSGESGYSECGVRGERI
ncbi:unnamed protein product [Staurois parvus]|uniref:Uncharacterized protein n=1 Tax=Staurois parvus TaxID=386267 RepID=A0ABN9HHE9_9NEOB|nr:unnamed protein product [Staurois parvus]